jgi:hypothetical protein
MQPITRVHNIFRIRTVINAVTQMNRKGKSPRDKEIGRVLADAGLSKLRREKMKDRIMRRARDHLLTAAYMGLLTRQNRPFGYRSTSAGGILQNYGIQSECPNDTNEEAVFIDKLMRLKLTNVYDMQSRNQYAKVRSRPCLFILQVLSGRAWLHEHQIAVATGGNRCDPRLADKDTHKLVTEICEYNKPTARMLAQFYKRFGVKSADMNNMTRNIRPLLDWCEAVGLVKSKEIEDTLGRWYKITDRGSRILKECGSMLPVWYVDLGEMASAKAAVLLFFIYGKYFDLSFDKQILHEELEVGLSHITVREIAKELKRNILVKFESNFSRLQGDIDFTFDYDVPPEKKAGVLAFLKSLMKLVRLRIDIEKSEIFPINNLRSSLDAEQKGVRSVVTEQFGQRTELYDDPVMAKVSELVPTAGVLGQYRSDFEKEVSLLLRLIGLNAIKYQGQLADRCSKTYLIKFFENNPDILITNGIESLVECKSIGEWKTLTGVKSIPKEILIYHQALPEVNSDSVLLVYEGELNSSSRTMLTAMLSDFNSIVFATKNYLINCIHKPALKQKMINTLKDPRQHNAEDHVLSA